MGERTTCGFMGFAIGAGVGYAAHVGVANGQPLLSTGVLVLLLGMLLGAVTGLYLGMTRKRVFIPSFAMLGTILGSIVALVTFAVVIATNSTLPWYAVVAPVSFLVGYSLCALCSRLAKRSSFIR